MGEVRAYELQPGNMFTVTPWGLLNMTIEEAEKAAEDDIEAVQFWADGSITFMKHNYDKTTESF